MDVSEYNIRYQPLPNLIILLKSGRIWWKARSLLTCQSLRLSTGRASLFFPCCENHAVDAGDFICLRGDKIARNQSLGVEDSWLNLAMTSGP